MLTRMEEKTCTGCDSLKGLDLFPRNKRKPDGRDPQCKVCTNKRQREAYARDPAKKIAATRQYHLDNPEWSKRVQADWHQKNAGRRYQDYLERGKDPVVAAKRRAATRRCESRRRAVRASVDSVVITEEEYASILESYDHRCWICGFGVSEDTLHWDHYRPLADGGKHVPSNVRPACGPCNVRKNSLWPITDERLDAIRRAVWVLRGVEGVIS